MVLGAVARRAYSARQTLRRIASSHGLIAGPEGKADPPDDCGQHAALARLGNQAQALSFGQRRLRLERLQ